MTMIIIDGHMIAAIVAQVELMNLRHLKGLVSKVSALVFMGASNPRTKKFIFLVRSSDLLLSDLNPILNKGKPISAGSVQSVQRLCEVFGIKCFPERALKNLLARLGSHHSKSFVHCLLLVA